HPLPGMRAILLTSLVLIHRERGCARNSGSFVEQCAPAENHAHFRRRTLGARMRKDDAPAVGRDVVLRSPVALAEDRHVQLGRYAEGEGVVLDRADRNAEKLTLAVDVVQLRPVAPPYRLIAAAGRYNVSPWRAGEAAHEHLGPARLFRHITDPAAIWRKARI